MARVRSVSTALAAVLGGVAAAQCGGTDVADGAIHADSAGIELVLNPGEDRLLTWGFERERVLGGAPEGPESFYRVRPGLVDVDERGSVYVLDPTNGRVAAFDSSGRVRWTAGRVGGGPGELLSPNSLSVSAAGTVHVHDPRKSALVRFDSAGRVLPQVPFPFWLMRPWEPHVHVLPRGLAVLALEPFRGSDERRVELLRVVDGDTVTLFSRNLRLSRTAQYPSCGMTLTLPTLFASQVRWDRSRSRIAVVTDAAYVIEIYGPDGLVRSIRRAIAPRAVSRAEALQVLQERSGLGGPLAPCNASAEEMLNNHGFAPELQIVRALAFAPDGELWVRRSGGLDGSEGPIDVFDNRGEYVGTLPADTPFPVVFLPGGRIGFAERDELDVERLVIARIRRH